MQIVVAALVTWVPIAATGFATEAWTGQRVPLLHDIAAHVRLVIGIPVLLFLDHVFPRSCRHAVEQVMSCGFVRGDQEERFERVLERTERHGDWAGAEALLAGIAICIGLGVVVGVAPAGGIALRPHLTATDYWYGIVSLPCFEFLIFRSVWRWLIWVGFLAGLSRVELELDVTHPDRRGGIWFLRKPSIAYCSILLFVCSAVLSAVWNQRFQFVTLGEFVPMLLAFAVIGTLVAFGPLLLFTVPLWRLRNLGIDELGGLAARVDRVFRERWMQQSGADVLQSSPVQNLAALGQTYRETVKEIRVVPLERRDVLTVLIATLSPVLPIMLARIPHTEWMAIGALLATGGRG